MIWKAKPEQWRLRFAILPLTIGDDVIWLRTYWAMPWGEYTKVRLDRPRHDETWEAGADCSDCGAREGYMHLNTCPRVERMKGVQ